MYVRKDCPNRVRSRFSPSPYCTTMTCSKQGGKCVHLHPRLNSSPLVETSSHRLLHPAVLRSWLTQLGSTVRCSGLTQRELWQRWEWSFRWCRPWARMKREGLMLRLRRAATW